jgi:hypothetical protein
LIRSLSPQSSSALLGNLTDRGASSLQRVGKINESQDAWVGLVLAALTAARPALADERADQERDCTGDVLTWCGQYVFAPDRDEQIGYCLWEHRTQIRVELFQRGVELVGDLNLRSGV